jgi:chromosomal replication initiator protein
VHELVTPQLTAAQVWQAALGELELQMTRATFDAWLRGTWLAAYGGETFTVAVASTYAVDWLAHRLNGTVVRTLRRVAGQEQVSVHFVVAKEIVEEVESVQEA